MKQQYVHERVKVAYTTVTTRGPASCGGEGGADKIGQAIGCSNDKLAAVPAEANLSASGANPGQLHR